MKTIHKYNIVFLDFDGVLTSKESNTYFNTSDNGYHYDQILFDRIINLCNKTNSKVIISSNWRRFNDDGVWVGINHFSYKNPIPNLVEQLKKYDLYAGMLPGVRHVKKSEALTEWFNDNKIKGNYVIFDDEQYEGFNEIEDYRHRFILTDKNTGITEENIKKAYEILTENDMEDINMENNDYELNDNIRLEFNFETRQRMIREIMCILKSQIIYTYQSSFDVTFYPVEYSFNGSGYKMIIKMSDEMNTITSDYYYQVKDYILNMIDYLFGNKFIVSSSTTDDEIEIEILSKI